jgi:hypothetical protein
MMILTWNDKLKKGLRNEAFLFPEESIPVRSVYSCRKWIFLQLAIGFLFLIYVIS